MNIGYLDSQSISLSPCSLTESSSPEHNPHDLQYHLSEDSDHPNEKPLSLASSFLPSDSLGTTSLVLTHPEDFATQHTKTLQSLKLELERKIEDYLKNKNERQVPIPKGNSAYSKAKRAEYIERNLDKAVKFYKISIRSNERVDSAIKDLATVLHQQGKTEEACRFLEEFRPYYKGDLNKYDNLWNNLRKQITPSGNCLNRTFIIPSVSLSTSEVEVRALFSNDSRIVDISFCYNWTEQEVAPLPPLRPDTKLCLISFVSYSAARKTFETLKDPSTHDFYWMNVRGEIVSKVGTEMINTAKSSEETSSVAAPKYQNLPTNQYTNNTAPSSRKTSFYVENIPKTSRIQTPSRPGERVQNDYYYHSEHFQKDQMMWNDNSNGYYQQLTFTPKTERVTKRLSFSKEPSQHPIMASRKRWSECINPEDLHPKEKKTWNCAVFVDMDGASSGDEKDDPQSKMRSMEKARSLRESISEEFMAFNTGIAKSAMGKDNSKIMKYDVVSDIKKKEELLQKEKESDTNFLKNLISRKAENMNAEASFWEEPVRKLPDRKTSWDPSMTRRKNSWEDKSFLEAILQRV